MNFLRTKLVYKCFPINADDVLDSCEKMSYQQLKYFLKKNHKTLKSEVLYDVFLSYFAIRNQRDREFYHKIIKLLLRYGANPLILSLEGESLLYRAFNSGETDLVMKFLQHLPDVNVPIERFRRKTPLHVAAQNTYKDIMLYLLDRGADVNARTTDSFTPLHLSICQPDPEVLKILLDHGADIEARNDHEETPLHWAFFYKNCHHLVNILMDRGADVTARDKGGRTPLHQFLHRKADSVEVCETLLKRGVDPTSTDVAGNTLLHSLTLSCTLNKLYPSSTIAEILVKAGTPINARNCEGQTALHIAARSGMDKSFLLTMLSLGSKIDIPDNNGWTVLKMYIFMNNKFGLEVLQHYALEERMGKFKFTEEMLTLIAQNKKYNGYLQACRLELDRLAEIKVGEDFSFSLGDLVTSNLIGATRYSESADLAQKLKKINATNFPIYGLTLTEKYRRGFRRKEAETVGTEFLAKVSSGVLNADCAREILAYIPTNDLEQLKHLGAKDRPKDCEWKNSDVYKTNLSHLFNDVLPGF